MKAIFLDRDGTIIEDKHYLSDVAHIHYLEGVKEALALFVQHNFAIFIVTNQSGIGRGFFSIEEMRAIHDAIKNDFPCIQDFAYCPHSPEENCRCRKPSPQMILDLIAKYNIDASESYMIGDKDIDVTCGENAHLKKSYLIDEKHDLLYFAKIITTNT